MDFDIDSTWVYVTPAADLRAVLVLSDGVTPPEVLEIDTRLYRLSKLDTLNTRDYLREQASE